MINFNTAGDPSQLQPYDPNAPPSSFYNQATGSMQSTSSVIGDLSSLFGGYPAPSLLQAYNDIQQAYSARLNDPTSVINDLYMEYFGRAATPWELSQVSPILGRYGMGEARKDIQSWARQEGQTFVDRQWDPTGIVGIGPAQFGHIDMQAWQQTVSAAENWASVTGWKNFPSLVTLYNAMQSGVYTDPQAAAAFFAKNALTQQSQSLMPWASTGDTPQQWRDRQNSYLDALQVYTGSTTADPYSQGIINQAMSARWSAERLTNTLLNDPTFQNKYGWTKYGYTYQSFQQYKKQNKQAIVSRYGADAASSDTAFLSDLAQPLQALHSSAGPTGVAQALQHQQVGMSAVR